MAENAAVAASALLVMSPGLDDETLRRGLAEARIRARFEVVPGTPKVVIDGAHNPDAIEALAAALDAVYPGVRPVVVLGAMRDKDVAGMLARVARFAAAVVAAPCGSARETAPGEIARLAGERGVPAEAAGSAGEALAAARRRAGSGGLVVVCGSLYLAGATLSALGAAG
jgi:dihydrofolate synthase/folylpolyglutamate synthase